MMKFKDQSENQKRSKQVSMDSWLLKPLSKRHENKNSKERLTNKQS